MFSLACDLFTVRFTFFFVGAPTFTLRVQWPLFSVSYSSPRGERLAILRSCASVVELDRALVRAFGGSSAMSVLLPRLAPNVAQAFATPNATMDVVHQACVSVESYLRSLNAIPGVATSSTLYDFLGIADTMTPLDWSDLFVGTQTLPYAPNTIILAEGETNEHLFLVVDGCVSIEKAGLRLTMLTRGA